MNKKTTTLGRQLENDIVFHEALLSRNHAEIVLEGNQYVLYDKGSTGGTYVNGRKIDHCLLNSGDLISLANIQIMFINDNSTLVDRSLGVTHGLGNLHDEQ
ncbi:MAG: FHA domain-containing protein [Anaerolineaceae bacterium]|nr:FHA domain-containing protein [Anaerolineaceae bacterium]